MSEVDDGRELADLADAHGEIRGLLLGWLEAVVVGDSQEARARFDSFDALLRAHAAMEEEFLLPRFVELGLETLGCSAAILLAEHAKIRRHLDRSRAEQPPAGAPIAPGERVNLVLGSRDLRELLEHHDRRERAGFFPALDAALAPSERAALYEICARSQSSAAAREAKPPSS